MQSKIKFNWKVNIILVILLILAIASSAESSITGYAVGIQTDETITANPGQILNIDINLSDLTIGETFTFEEKTPKDIELLNWNVPDVTEINTRFLEDEGRYAWSFKPSAEEIDLSYQLKVSVAPGMYTLDAIWFSRDGMSRKIRTLNVSQPLTIQCGDYVCDETELGWCATDCDNQAPSVVINESTADTSYNQLGISHIYVTTKDDYEVATVTLFYRAIDGNWASIEMNEVQEILTAPAKTRSLIYIILILIILGILFYYRKTIINLFHKNKKTKTSPIAQKLEKVKSEKAKLRKEIRKIKLKKFLTFFGLLLLFTLTIIALTDTKLFEFKLENVTQELEYYIVVTDTAGNTYTYNNNGQPFKIEEKLLEIPPPTILPGINFLPPTPEDEEQLNKTHFEVNVSIINISNVNSIIYNWDNTETDYLDDSLILMYNFDNVSAIGESIVKKGDKTIDISTHGNDGISTSFGSYSPPTWTENGKYNGALNFGGRGFVVIPETHYPDFDNLNAFTVGMWYHPTTFDHGHALFTNGNIFYLHYDTRPGYGLGLDIYYDGGNKKHVSGKNVNLNEWHYITARWDGNKGYLYLNGEEISNFNAPNTLAERTLTSKLSIGHHWNVQYMDGMLDEVKVWNRALSPTEIKQQYSLNLNKYDTNKWWFYLNQTDLEEETYTYKISVSNQSNDYSTEQRTIIVKPTIPKITFLSPEKNLTTNKSSINISIDLTSVKDLNSITYNWNNKNHSYYDDSLLLMMNFDKLEELEETDTQVADLSTYKNNGEVRNGPTWTSQGKHGGAYSYPGSRPNLIDVSNDKFANLNELTFNAWVNITGDGSPYKMGCILCQDYMGYGANFPDTVDGPGLYYLQGNIYWKVIGYEQKDSKIALPASLNKWYYITATLNSTHQCLYLDENSECIEHGLTPKPDNTGSLFIGTNPDDSAGYMGFKGIIDEVYVWSRSLTKPEIEQNYFSHLKQYDTKKYLLTINQQEGINNPLSKAQYTYQTFVKVAKAHTFSEKRTITTNYSQLTANPEDNSEVDTTPIKINATIHNNDLKEFIYTWNNTDFYLYDSDLVAMYNFDNLNALGENFSKVVDLSRYENDCEVMHTGYTPWEPNGKYNGAYKFKDGYPKTTQDYINCGNGDYLHINGPFTISTWIKPSTMPEDGSYRMILSKGDIAAPNGGYGLRFVTNQNTLGFWTTSWYSSSGSNGIKGVNWNYGDESEIIDKWWHIVGIYDGTNNSLYINGELVGTDVGSTPGVNTDYILKLGKRGTATGGAWGSAYVGLIDEVRIWKKPLSKEEVYKLYSSNLNKFDTEKWYFQIDQNKNLNQELNYGTYNYSITIFNESEEIPSGTRTIQVTTDAIPAKIEFLPPTPENNQQQEQTSVKINVSITEKNLGKITYNFKEIKEDQLIEQTIAHFDGNQLTTNGQEQLSTLPRTYSIGKFGQAINLTQSGSVSYNLTKYPTLVNATQGTVMFWFKPTWDENDGVCHGLFEFLPTSNYKNRISLNKRESNVMHFTTWGSNNVQRGAYSWNGDWTGNQWHHVTITYGNNIAPKFYFDGVNRITSIADPRDETDPIDKIRIGNDYLVCTKGIQSLVDEFKTFNEVLSPEEVKEEYEFDLKHYALYDDSLFLMYNFDNIETIGENSTQIVDLSHYRRNASISNVYTPKFRQGKYGLALELNSSNDDVGVSNTRPPSKDMTFAIWAKPTYKSSAGKYLFASEGGNRAGSKGLYYVNDKFGFYVYNNSKKGFTVQSGSVGAFNKWNHVVGVIDYTNKEIRIYVDGELKGTKKLIGTFPSSLNLFKIGARTATGHTNYHFRGLIDEVRVYSRALPSDEIKQLYMYNLKKSDIDKWELYIDQKKDIGTSLYSGDYSYKVSATDFNGQESSGQRNITIINQIQPGIHFVPNTPEDKTATTNPILEVNTSIAATDTPTKLTYNFNGQNYNLYDNSLALFYNFDNISAIGESYNKTGRSTVMDLSQYGYHSQTYNFDYYNPTGGKYNGAFEFDGINDHIFVQKSIIGDNNSYTTSFWTKLYPTGKFQYPIVNIYEGAYGSNRKGFEINIKNSGEVYLQSVGWNMYSNSITTTDTIDWGKWQHIATVFSIEDNTMYIYINGKLSKSATIGHKGFRDYSKLDIGGYYQPSSSASRYINGSIDKVMMWNRSLSPDEIKFLYNSNLNKYEKDKWLFHTKHNLTNDKEYRFDTYTFQTSAEHADGTINSTEKRTIAITTLDNPQINLNINKQTFLKGEIVNISGKLFSDDQGLSNRPINVYTDNNNQNQHSSITHSTYKDFEPGTVNETYILDDKIALVQYTPRYRPKRYYKGDYLSPIIDAGKTVYWDNTDWSEPAPYQDSINLNYKDNVMFMCNFDQGTDCYGLDKPYFNNNSLTSGVFNNALNTSPTTRTRYTTPTGFNRSKGSLSLWAKHYGGGTGDEWFEIQDGNHGILLYNSATNGNLASYFMGYLRYNLHCTDAKSRWHNIVLVWDVDDIGTEKGSYRLYCDGVKKFATNRTWTQNTTDFGGSITFGDDRGRNNRVSIDDVILWHNIDLTDEEILDLYTRSYLHLNVSVRTSNDNITWSNWKVHTKPGQKTDLSGRYLQYKVNMLSNKSAYTPELHNITFNYIAPGTDNTGNYIHSFSAPNTSGTHELKVNSSLGWLPIEQTSSIKVLPADLQTSININPAIHTTNPITVMPTTNVHISGKLNLTTGANIHNNKIQLFVDNYEIGKKQKTFSEQITLGKNLFNNYKLNDEYTSEWINANQEVHWNKIDFTKHTTSNNLNQGLVLYLPFDKDAKDYSGQNHKIICLNNSICPNLIDNGKSNSAYEFNRQGLFIPYSKSTDLTSTRTISVWVKLNQSGNYGGVVVGKPDLKNTLIFYNNRFTYYFGSATARLEKYQSSSFDKWYHLVVVKNETHMILYLNSEPISSASVSTTPSSSREINIGYRYDGSPKDWFEGTIDEIRMYNRSLSPDEVKQLYSKDLTNLNISTRTSNNPDESTTDWKTHTTTDSPINQQAQYLQYKVSMSTEDNEYTPILNHLTLDYNTIITNDYGIYNYSYLTPSAEGIYEIKTNASYLSLNNQESIYINISDFMPPIFTFNQPTPDQNTITTNTNQIINTTITEGALKNLTYSWTDHAYHDDNLVLDLSLDEDSSVVKDKSGHNNDGTVNGAAFVSDGKHNGGYNFISTENDYIRIPHSSSLLIKNNITMGIWFKPSKGSTQAGWSSLFSKRDSSSSYRIGLRSSGSCGYGIQFEYGTQSLQSDSDCDLSIGNWHHIVVTRQDDGTMSIYIDGVLNKRALLLAGEMGINGYPIDIGGDPYWKRWINGTVDEVKIWNKVLSELEIKQQYESNGRTKKYNYYDDSLISMFDFDNHSKLNDLSSYENHATCFNCPTYTQGKSGGAYDFDGVDDYLNFTLSSGFPYTHGSMELWFKPNQASNEISNNFNLFSTESNKRFYLTYRADKDDFYFTHNGNGCGGFYAGTETVSFNANEWQHVLITWNNNPHTVEFYFNGNRLTFDAGSKKLICKGGHSSNLFLGYNDYGKNNYFDGAIDEFRMWSRTLDEQEIKHRYNSNFKKTDLNNWIFNTPQNNLDDGIYQYYFDASDKKEQQNSEQRTITVDTTPPTIQFTPPTLQDNKTINIREMDINISITEANLDQIILNVTSNLIPTANYSLYDDDLLLMYNFDKVSALEETDTKVIDISQYGYDATINGATYTTQGKYNGAYEFNGISDFILLDEKANFNLTPPISIQAWIKPNQANPFKELNQCFINLTVLNEKLKTNQWNHVIATWNGSEVIYYLAGIKDSTHTLTCNAQDQKPTLSTLVAALTRMINGTIDDLKIWKRTISNEGESHLQYVSNLQKHNSDKWTMYQRIGKGIRLPDANYTYQYFARDKVNHLIQTELRKFTLDATPPRFHNLTINSPKINEKIYFNLTLTENQKLNSYTFSWNHSGTWTNYTYSITGPEHFVSEQRTITLPHLLTIAYAFYADDINNNKNNTGIQTFTIANTPPTFDQDPTVKIVQPGENLNYDIDCSDADNQAITYYDNTTLFNINPTTGIIMDTPTDAEAGNHTIKIICSDSYNNTTKLFKYAIIDVTSPTWSNNRVSNSSPKHNDTITFNINWKDNVQLDTYIFSWNDSGTWVNFTHDINGTSHLVSEQKTITATRSDTIAWTYYANDTSRNKNKSNIWTLTVSNSRPQSRNTSIDPTDLFTNLTATIKGLWTFFDYDRDTQTNYQTKWFNNSKEITRLRDKTSFNSQNTTKGDNWTFSIRVHDSYTWSDWYNSSEFTILRNTSPIVNFVNISPNPAEPEANLNCIVNITHVRLKSFKVNFTWYKNGTRNMTWDTRVNCTNGTLCYTNKFVPNLDTKLDDKFICSILAFDGYNYTGWINSSEITIKPKPPVKVPDPSQPSGPGPSSSSSSGSGSRTSIITRTAEVEKNLKIVVPQITQIYKGEDITLPVTLINNGSIRLNNIKVQVEGTSQDLSFKLSEGEVTQLNAKEQKKLNLLIKSKNITGVHKLKIKAQSDKPSLEDTESIIIEEILTEDEEEIVKLYQKVIYLLDSSPECLEIKELESQVKEQINKNNFKRAKILVNTLIELCDELRNMGEKPTYSTNDIMDYYDYVKELKKKNITTKQQITLEGNVTTINKIITNNEEESIDDILVIEAIDKQIAENMDNIEFLTPNYEVTESGESVQWKFKEIPAKKSISITYKVKGDLRNKLSLNTTSLLPDKESIIGKKGFNLRIPAVIDLSRSTILSTATGTIIGTIALAHLIYSFKKKKSKKTKHHKIHTSPKKSKKKKKSSTNMRKFLHDNFGLFKTKAELEKIKRLKAMKKAEKFRLKKQRKKSKGKSKGFRYPQSKKLSPIAKKLLKKGFSEKQIEDVFIKQGFSRKIIKDVFKNI